MPRPEHELAAYGRPLLLVITGIMMVLGFVAETFGALLQRKPISLGFWSWVAAGETAAWHLKWVFIPITLLVVWGGGRIYRYMAERPARFVGLRHARRSLLASSFVGLLIAVLIVITVPARIRQHHDRLEATEAARGYTFARAVLQFSERYGTNPADPNDLRLLPDADGSIADALANMDTSTYRPSGADLAIKSKQRSIRGSALVRVNSTTDDPPVGVGGVIFTNYEMRLPGPDGILNTDDDLILRDGVIVKASEMKSPPAGALPPNRVRKR